MHIYTETGLYRVNGSQFDSTLGEQFPSSSTWSLYADADGEWIGYLFGRANLVHQGKVTHFPRDRMGEPRFELTADNGDGRWSEHEVLTFHVAAAFYQTAWFRSLTVLFVTVLFALIIIV